jgi:hypothetical protein
MASRACSLRLRILRAPILAALAVVAKLSRPGFAKQPGPSLLLRAFTGARDA